MNGRLYDANVHRFLSPDNYVQDPYNTQSFNRYGYVFNNPLSYNDPSGELAWFVPVIIGAVIGGGSAAIQGGNFGDILTGGLIGGLSGLAGFGVGNLAGGAGFFSSSLVTTGFAQGAMVGFAGGFAAGFVGGSLSAIASGQSIGDALSDGFMGGMIGGAAGGLINGVSSEVRLQKKLGVFRKSLDKLGINSGDSVPMTDKFLAKVQKEWIKNTPSNLIKQSVENVPANAVKSMNRAGAAAITLPTTKAGILTGKASIYYNPNGAAFTSAKQLFLTMSHEMVHVSQYGVLGSMGMSYQKYRTLFKAGLGEVFEFHAYSFENSLGGSNFGGFTSNSAKSLMSTFPKLYQKLNYINFPWTRQVQFN